ncbi:MAG: hypothetical protein P8Z76_14870 [Alphaproteobacteria bacterium]
MRLLAVMFIALVATMPAHAAAMRCDMSKKFACTAGGCRDNAITGWNVVDFKTNRFSRCDRKGCDHYPMTVKRSGLFLNIEIPGRAMFAKMSVDGSKYLEVVSLGTSVLVSYGSCK